mgnify:CR=1 FL=1
MQGMDEWYLTYAKPTHDDCLDDFVIYSVAVGIVAYMYEMCQIPEREKENNKRAIKS